MNKNYALLSAKVEVVVNSVLCGCGEDLTFYVTHDGDECISIEVKDHECIQRDID